MKEREIETQRETQREYLEIKGYMKQSQVTIIFQNKIMCGMDNVCMKLGLEFETIFFFFIWKKNV